jgi:hypothetical protein
VSFLYLLLAILFGGRSYITGVIADNDFRPRRP